MLALIVVVLAGCGGTGPIGRGPIATVNGTAIHRSDVEDLLDGQRQLTEATAAVAREQAGSADAGFTVEDVERSLSVQLDRFGGSGSSTIPTDVATGQLAELVQLELMRAAIEKAGGEVTEQHRQTARAELEAEISQSGLSIESVPPVLLDHYTELTAVNLALEDIVPDDVGEDLVVSADEYEQSLRDAFEANGASYRQLCLHELLFEEEDAAVAAVDRLEGGEDVAAVHADLGVDDPARAPQECQTLPAGTLVEYVGQEAFTAEAGHVFPPEQVGGPEQGQPTLWSVVAVEDVDVPDFDDVRDQLAQDFPDTSGAEVDDARNRHLDDLLRSVFLDADVTIDPRWGTWDPETKTVVVPVDPGAEPPPDGDFGDLELVEPAP